MKIIVARTAGFCMGVRRAVEMVFDAPGKYTAPIYTYGPLIHNPQVLDLCAEKGIRILDTIPEKGCGTVLIRAHGVPPRIKTRLKAAGFTVVDTTCPRVIKVQTIIRAQARKGYEVIILGDQDHPEVVGLLGYAGDRGHVVGSLEALAQLPEYEKAIVVAQTTQNTRLFEQVQSWVESRRPHYRLFNTICDSTEKRQHEVRRMAPHVDALVVVGGRQSGNTRRLAEIASNYGKTAFHIETAAELDADSLAGCRSIGITAGASTPSWIIKQVFRAVEKLPTVKPAGLGGRWLTFQRVLLLTNVYVALGAGCLAFAVSQLQRGHLVAEHVLAAMFYVLSMHILNHLTGRAEDRYNSPDRERFYSAHKRLLAAVALAAGTLGLMAAFRMGRLPFGVLLVMSALGLAYNIQLVPSGVWPRLRWRRLRDIPGSKTLLIALAWAVVTSLLPVLGGRHPSGWATIASFGWTAGMVFSRTLFFDILDMQGDRIVGKETLAIVLGEEKSFKLIYTVLAITVLGLVAGALAGLLPPLAYGLTGCSLLMAAMAWRHQRRCEPAGIKLEFGVESIFILAGIMALIFCLLAGKC